MVFLPALFAEVDSEHCKTTKTELFERIDNHLKLPTIFARHQSFWLGIEYFSGLTKKEEQFLHLILSKCENVTIHLQTLYSDVHFINSNSHEFHIVYRQFKEAF